MISPAAARSVIAEIERRIDFLVDFPYLAPMTDETGIYELPVIRYPYKVYYRIEGTRVVIMHVRDARRRPWKGRS